MPDFIEYKGKDIAMLYFDVDLKTPLIVLLNEDVLESLVGASDKELIKVAENVMRFEEFRKKYVKRGRIFTNSQEYLDYSNKNRF